MKKFIFAIVLIVLLALGKWVLWDMQISSGKRVGNLTKISKKGQVPFLKTWEGTLDEGSGDKLTSYFSVKDEAVALELYNYEGKEVILFYTQHILGWPRDTNYLVTSWKPKEAQTKVEEINSPELELLSTNLFCSFLGSLYKNKELYQSIKEFIRVDNPFLFNQYKKCGD